MRLSRTRHHFLLYLSLNVPLLTTGRVAPQRCLPVLQRITSAASALASPAGSNTARSMASLHTPVASCSYTPLRTAAHRASAIPRNGFSSSLGPGSQGLNGIAGLARSSTALTGTSLLPQHSSPSHGLQPSWSSHDRCCPSFNNHLLCMSDILL